MYLIMIFLPLLACISSGLFGRKLGISGSQIITCTSVITTTILAIISFFEVGLNNTPVFIKFFTWIDSESLNVLWSFNFDALTVSMLIPVLIVSSLVHVYSIGYMSHDPWYSVRGKHFFSWVFFSRDKGKKMNKRCGDKLPNSGELLKLLVPTHYRNVVGGWSNYSGFFLASMKKEVISQKMTLCLLQCKSKLGWINSIYSVERKMDNRGSKSTILLNIVVKEQRVDGNWSVFTGLRYTLKGLERDKNLTLTHFQFFFNSWSKKKIGERSPPIQVVAGVWRKEIKKETFFTHLPHFYSHLFFSLEKKKMWVIQGKQLRCYNTYTRIPSKQFYCKKYSNFSYKKLSDINPQVWSGLIDGEGSFNVIVVKHDSRRLGWGVELNFQIGLHTKDLNLLFLLQKYLANAGSINISQNKEIVNYSINSLEGLKRLIYHLDNYPLQTQKRADYLLFKQVYLLIEKKQHLTFKGFNDIINIKASMNWGLSDIMKSRFPNHKPVIRPKFDNKQERSINPYWLAGFISAEGNFDVRIPTTTSKLGYRVQLRFRITQHNRDIELMESIVNYLKCGKVYKYGGKSAVVYTVVDINDITNIIIPLLETHTVIGTKYYDYLDWCKIHDLITNGLHLTTEGIESIRKIKSHMNNRDFKDNNHC